MALVVVMTRSMRMIGVFGIIIGRENVGGRSPGSTGSTSFVEGIFRIGTIVGIRIKQARTVSAGYALTVVFVDVAVAVVLGVALLVATIASTRSESVFFLGFGCRKFCTAAAASYACSTNVVPAIHGNIFGRRHGPQ